MTDGISPHGKHLLAAMSWVLASALLREQGSLANTRTVSKHTHTDPSLVGIALARLRGAGSSLREK